MAKKNLVIVESPTKVKAIKKFLGSNYEVAASNGHVRDLPKSRMGVDVEHDYDPQYITIRGKGELLAGLRKMVKKADHVYLATDPDREGEAIAWHLIAALKLEENKSKVSRITFNEITKNAVRESLKHARQIDMDLVDAQQARRVLDRVVGYEISPLLWEKIKRGLSAGRVQSVALRIICDREEEIDSFLPQESDFAQIELSVESQGIVMEPERLKLLTQPSEYFIDRITGDLSPLDIALVILKSYVKAMNTEQLSVTSDPNHGTAISLTLRLALSRKQEGEANPSAEASIDLRGKRVLIVDDNEINLEISEKLLLSKGIDVVSATNGQEAVHRFIAEKGQFDVILMDVLMPVMDGLEATRQIRSTQEIPNAQNIPIIAMTVNGLSENYDESFRAGMNAHLLKPVNPERLYSVISKVLSKKSES